MNINKRIFLLLSVIVLFWNINGQSVKILNKSTEFPISGVSIFNQTQNISTITDSDGYFDLSLFAEQDTIFIRHLAFKCFCHLIYF